VDLIKKRTNENPVFYVQYAHARISAILRNAKELGMKVEIIDFQQELLDSEAEEALSASIALFPKVVASAAELREPHRVARYLEELAGHYHHFYAHSRVLPMGEEPITALHQSRALLCEATRQVLANGLAMLGVSAPEKM
jgi:arginyl-tRNA synthetase